jgi:hypothetical protein
MMLDCSSHKTHLRSSKLLVIIIKSVIQHLNRESYFAKAAENVVFSYQIFLPGLASQSVGRAEVDGVHRRKDGLGEDVREVTESSFWSRINQEVKLHQESSGNMYFDNIIEK